MVVVSSNFKLNFPLSNFLKFLKRVVFHSLQFTFLDLIRAWIQKSTNHCNFCPLQKKQIHLEKRVDPNNLSRRQVSHSCFSYKHYSHFNDHHSIASSTMNWKMLGMLLHAWAFSTLLSFTTMLVGECRVMSLWALNLVVGMYL